MQAGEVIVKPRFILPNLPAIASRRIIIVVPICYAMLLNCCAMLPICSAIHPI
jgi:hypothetical protein